MTLALPRPVRIGPAVGRVRAAGLRRLLGGTAAVLTVALVVVVTSLNLAGAPYIEDDEGTYIAQAQAVLHLGALSPYTYFYDHPPFGWIQIAGWLALTGDGAGTGGAVTDGRILMVLVQAVSSVLIIHIGRRITGSIWAGILAALLAGLSPYAVFFHRRVLLDNLAALWLLASTALLVAKRPTLAKVALGALAFGVAVWSKEIAVTFLPALAVLAVRRAPRESRAYVLGGWFAVAIGVVSLYVVMALLKGELFPTGTLLGGTNAHVSLLGTLAWESSRGQDGGVLQPGSGFWTSMLRWAAQDPLIVVGGTAAAVGAVALIRRHAALSALGIAVVTFVLFLGRGGLTLDFYLVPVVPFLALALAGVAAAAMQALAAVRMPRLRIVTRTVAVVAVAGLATAAVIAGVAGNRTLFTRSPASGQAEAAAWIERHLPRDSRMLMDMYLYPALHDGSSGAPYRYAEYYWTATDDPAVLSRVFHGRWQDVDDVIVTPQMLIDAQDGSFPLLRQALEHSEVIATFDTGYRVEVRRVGPGLVGSGFGWQH